ncbi:tRNA-specific 2-thiouridylase [Desulfovibrio desulfuricans]|uniref:tRNA-specific 2-thiouridylase n=1 Tax=Desulfovibrio desulfuricans TaxID=876 RepID=UPI002D7F5806|nr:tRNA-specific 2-thiouridylase [Desulfovibrio desulfuricans]
MPPPPSFPPSLMCCVNSYALHGDNNKGVTKPMNAPHIHSPIVAVAVSGGVDSLCAVVMLHNAGFRVLALHGLFLPDGPTVAPAGLAEACATLGVPLHVADLREAFQREVLTPFAAAYAQGRTPNPCAYCNRAIKFGVLLDTALALGADKLATGHYARLVPGPSSPATAGEDETSETYPLLAAAADAAKDQSYFLSLVPRQRLSHALFPLYGQNKEQTRAIVAAAGLAVPLPSESQDICFAPPAAQAGMSAAEAYRPFLERHWQAAGTIAPGPGPVLLQDAAGNRREIARHKGLWRYTEGQRKGLGIAHTEPLFVLTKDSATNSLVVGPRALLGIRTCVTGPANIALPPHLWPDSLLVRLRHRQRPCPARVQVEDACLRIMLAEPQFPTAPGQVAAVYDEEGRVLAAGVVEEMA